MPDFTKTEKAECAEREVKQRQKVYGRRVEEGRMSAEFAAKQIAIMESIRDDYRALAEAEEAKGRLL